MPGKKKTRSDVLIKFRYLQAVCISRIKKKILLYATVQVVFVEEIRIDKISVLKKQEIMKLKQ